LKLVYFCGIARVESSVGATSRETAGTLAAMNKRQYGLCGKTET